MSTVPKLRFKEFNDSWSIHKLKEITTYVDYRGKTPEKSEQGVFLVTAKNIKNGFIDYNCSSEYISPNIYDEAMRRGKPELGDVLLTTEAPLGNVAQIDRTDIALAQRVIKFRGRSILSNDFLKQNMLSDGFQRLLLSKAIGSTVLGIQGKVLHGLPLTVPSREEQQKIADFLTAVDTKIEQLTRKEELLKQYKKGVMQKIFSQEIRFKADDGSEFPEWEYLNGDELFQPISNKDHNSDLPVLAITQEHGAIPRDLIDYQISVTEKSVSTYKVVEVGDFIISLRSFQGGIEYSDYKGICSPAYIILRKTRSLNDRFYKAFLKTDHYIKLMNMKIEGIRDGKMISFKQFSEVKLPLPCLDEQGKIANLFLAIDEKLRIASSQLESAKAFKKGLLQQMFV